MNKLIIKAHPNPDWFSHQIAEKYKKASEDHHELKVIDLYNAQFKQEFLTLDEKNQPTHDELRKMMQELVLRADELVFVYPVWRGDAPAILKNWFDTNITSWFAYKYNWSTIPDKLLSGKKATIFCTTWWPQWVNYTLWLCHWATWKWNRLWYCGIWLKKFTVFSDMSKYRFPEDRLNMLAKVEEIAKLQ